MLIKIIMEITSASLLDLNALNKLQRACFEKEAWSFLDLIAVLTLPDVIRLRALEAARMIGFVAGDPHPSDGFSWIATLAVAPEYRRQGIGRTLLRACEERLKTPRIRLSVRASNAAAICLYEEEGYQRVDFWKAYYKDGEAAVVMEKARGI